MQPTFYWYLHFQCNPSSLGNKIHISLCWEKWRQGFNLVLVVSMVLQAFGVYWSNTFIRLNKTDSYYKLRTIYTPWPRPRSERERKRNEREKFKYWLSWILICWIFRLASGLRSWALWMTSPGLVLTRSWTGLHPLQLWALTSLGATPKLTYLRHMAPQVTGTR